MSTDAPLAGQSRPARHGSPLRRAALAAWRAFDACYVGLLGRPGGQKVNARVLQTVLRARGYNNLSGFAGSGEAWFLERLASSRPTLCVDVGANVGTYTQALLARTSAVVHAFEPMPASFRRLQSLAAEHPGRLRVHELALGDTDGEAPMAFGAEESELATLSDAALRVGYVGATSGQRRAVRVRRLDTLVDSGEFDVAAVGGTIDLLKIDTEGFEYPVLLGARDTLRRWPPRFIQLEFNWHQLFAGHALWRFAELLPGYRAWQLLPNGTGWHRVDPSMPEANVYCYSNFVFVRADVPTDAFR
jgi:FkbM family methyltransferase